MGKSIEEINVLNKKENKTVFNGKVEGKNILLEVEDPVLDSSLFNILKDLKHDVKVENDVYKTAIVECELDSQINIEYVDSDLKPKNYKFCYFCETYEEYLQSKEILTPVPKVKDIIYEDDSIVLFSSFCMLYCIIKNANSIRDLTNAQDLITLKERLYNILTNYGFKNSEMCFYFDYNGKTDSLLLNISDLSKGISRLNATGKFIYLDTLIKNLTIDPDYYKGNINYIKKVLC